MLIAQAAEEVCRRLGLNEDVEFAVALAVETVKKNREAVEGLTPMEAAVWRCLIAAKGGWVTNEQIAALGRGQTEWAPRSAIRQLRKKRPGRIETGYGRGYRVK